LELNYKAGGYVREQPDLGGVFNYSIPDHDKPTKVLPILICVTKMYTGAISPT
jgi:hypothetical protein